MDPSATLSDIFDEPSSGPTEHVLELTAALREWLDKGGFTPGDIRKDSLLDFLEWAENYAVVNDFIDDEQGDDE